MATQLSREAKQAILLTSMRVYPLKLYIKKTQNLILLCIGLVLNIASWVWLLLNIGPHLGQVFLHYNILFGVNLVGPWYAVFALPLAGLCIIILNALLGWMLYKQDEFASYLLGGVSVFVNALLLISSALLVFLNV
jgi:hypothetical protein